MKHNKRLNDSDVGFSVTYMISRGPFRSPFQNETEFERRGMWFLMFILVLLGALVLSSARALAMGSACYSAHDIDRKKAEQSVQARRQILEELETRRKNISSTQRGMLKKIMQEIRNMEDLSMKQDQKVVGGIKLDFLKLPQTPDFEEATMTSLTKAYTFETDPEEQAHWRQKAHEAIYKDPYFNWLQLHQVMDGFPGDSDVRDYLFALLEDFPPGQRLSPEVAFLQVYRDSDPRATLEQIQRIDEILRMQSVMAALLEDQRILNLSDAAAGPWNAWGLAPNLAETKRNLDMLLEPQVQLHGARFPRKAYELAGRLLMPMPMHESQALLSNEKFSGESLNSRPSDLTDTAALRKYLELPADFSETELRRVMSVIQKANWGSRGGSYQIFLFEAFEDPSSFYARRIRSLLTLIEFMEVMNSLGGNNKLWPDLLEAHVQRFYQH